MPRNRIAAVVAAAALVGGGAGAVITIATGHDSSRNAVTTTVVAQRSNVANGDLTVGQIAKDATGSVVEVDSTSTSSSSPFPGGGSTSAEGTGFVYDTKGDILTNEHVVDGASSVRVKFSDGYVQGEGRRHRHRDRRRGDPRQRAGLEARAADARGLVEGRSW